MKIKITILSLITLLTLSCATPSRLYKKGNYYRATLVSVSKLRSKPNNQEAQEILSKTYPLALQVIKRQIDNMEYQKDPNKYYSIVKLYSMLNTMAEEIEKCPKAHEIIPEPTYFTKELQASKEAGAEAYYRLGLTALAQSDVKQARLAVVYFHNSNNFYYGYKDVISLTQQAKYQSILRVLVEKPIIKRGYQVSSDFFFDNLLDKLRQTNYANQVDFFTQTDNILPNQVIVLDFVDFMIGNTKETEKTTYIKRDSVITGYVNVRGERLAVYGTVKARFIERRIDIVSAGSLMVKIIDSKTNRVLRQQIFSGQYIWTSFYGTYQGDERALTDKQLRLCNSPKELPPMPQDLFIEVTRPIYSKTVSFLTDYYYNY